MELIKKYASTKKILIVLGIGLILCIAYLLTRTNIDTDQHYVAPVDITQQSTFVHLYEDSLLNYNGLGFFKTNIDDGAVETLLQGNKLPKPKNIYWVQDRGALITFSESFRYTAIEQELSKRGESIDIATQNYTWYIDFSSGDISFVSELPYRKNLAALVASEFIYFVPDFFGANSVEVEGISSSSVYVFSLEKKKTELVSEDLGLIDVSSLRACSQTGTQVCLTAREANSPDYEGVFTIDSSGQADTLHASEGRVFPTNMPGLYVSTKDPDTREEDREYVDYPPSEARLYNVAENTVRKLGFDISSVNPLVHFYDSSYYVLNNEAEDALSEYVSGGITADKAAAKIKSLLSSEDATPISKNFVTSLTSENTGVRALVVDSEGTFFIVDNTPRSVRMPEPATDTSAVITSCLQEGEDYQFLTSTQQFRIFLPLTGSLPQRLSAISSCLVSNKTDIHNYTYYFGVRSPSNGRLISD